jgi:hypothetical protein
MAKLEGPGGSQSEFWPDPFRGPVHLTFHWGLIDGIPECVGLDVRLFREKNGERHTAPGAEPQAITATLFRQLPVASLIEDAAKSYAQMASHVARGGKGSNPKAKTPGRRMAKAFDKRATRKTGAERHWTRERLETVAAIYRDALARKSPPTQAVAEAIPISHSMAAKLVRRCRDEGLLGETGQGKAGGARPPRKRKRG